MEAILKFDGPLNLGLYLNWTCQLLEAYLSGGNFRLQYLETVQKLLTILSPSPRESISNEELLWIAVSIWNESTLYWSVQDHDTGRKWSELALQVASFCKPSEQIKNVKKIQSD